MHARASLHLVEGQSDLRRRRAVRTGPLQRPDISTGTGEQLLHFPGGRHGDLRDAGEACHRRDVHRGRAGGGGSGAARIARSRVFCIHCSRTFWRPRSRRPRAWRSSSSMRDWPASTVRPTWSRSSVGTSTSRNTRRWSECIDKIEETCVMCTHCAGNLFGSVAIKSPQITRREFAAVAVGAMGAGLTAPIASGGGGLRQRHHLSRRADHSDYRRQALCRGAGGIGRPHRRRRQRRRDRAAQERVDPRDRSRRPHPVTGLHRSASAHRHRRADRRRVHRDRLHGVQDARGGDERAAANARPKRSPASGFCSPISTICCRAATCRRPSSTLSPPTIRSSFITSTCIPRRRTAPLCRPWA